MLDIVTVQEAYLENADYFAEQSVAKCKAFLTACNRLLVMLPAATSKSGDEMQWSIEAIEKQLTAARNWLSSRVGAAAGSRTNFADLEDFRI